MTGWASARAADRPSEGRNVAIEIDIRIDGGDWRRMLPTVESICRETAAKAVAVSALTSVEVSLVLSDDAAVAALNGAYRGKAEPTNVLSFPAGDGAGLSAIGPADAPPRLLGDVIVAYETTVAEAMAGGKSLADHLRHLVVHGVLHLLGHDHQSDADAAAMERLEAEILRSFGVEDPYRDEKHFVA